jgi:hypothetical protein
MNVINVKSEFFKLLKVSHPLKSQDNNDVTIFCVKVKYNFPKKKSACKNLHQDNLYTLLQEKK